MSPMLSQNFTLKKNQLFGHIFFSMRNDQNESKFQDEIEEKQIWGKIVNKNV